MMKYKCSRKSEKFLTQIIIIYLKKKLIMKYLFMKKNVINIFSFLFLKIKFNNKNIFYHDFEKRVLCATIKDYLFNINNIVVITKKHIF